MQRSLPYAVVALVPILGQSARLLDAAPLRYDNHRIFRVDVKTPQQLEDLERLGANILNCAPGVGPMDVLIERSKLQDIERMGLASQLLQDDVQGAVDRELHSAQAAEVAGADPFDDFFLSYHPYDAAGGILWYMNELASRYPTLVSLVDVGTTLEGRTIWGMRVTSEIAAHKPAVLYFACEHAREWVACTHPLYVATHLVENYAVNAEVTELVDNVEFFLIPVFNVDGYVYSWTTDRFWRKNRRGSHGVDLNRNWSEGWGGAGSSNLSTSPTYRGTAPFSEPETQELRDFIIAHPNIRAQLDVHSYGQFILWPYGSTSTWSPDHPVYKDVGGAMQSLIYGVHGVNYNAGPTYSTLYPASGLSLDWTYVQRGILSFSYECRDTGVTGFTLPQAQIIPNNEELLPATMYLAGTDWVRLPLRMEYPAGLPSTVAAGIDTVIPVRIPQEADPVDPDGVALHYRFEPDAAYVEAPVSWLGGDDYQAVVPATSCFSSPEFHFRATTMGGVGVEYPNQRPVPQAYTAEVVADAVPFFEQAFDSDPGWPRTGSWAFGPPAGLGGASGGPDPTSGRTGVSVYGFNPFGDYANGIPAHHLTSPPINCTGRSGVHLTFWRWLGVESGKWDHASVRVSTNGAAWTTVWENESEVIDSSWVLQDIDISALADNQPTVYLRWTMGPTDYSVVYCGWNIDDVGLYASACDTLRGDHNADGAIDIGDHGVLESCYVGPATRYPTGCRAFDFDEDGDVDCPDAGTFREAWTGAGAAPVLAACVRETAPRAVAAGSRYVLVTPPPIDAPVALRLSSPIEPCWERFADFDTDPGLAALGIARLSETPVYRLPSEWGDLRIADREVIPSRAYPVQLQFDDGGLSPAATAITSIWGDTIAPYGLVDAVDIAGGVGRFKGLRESPPVERCDLYPSVPDQIVDALDITMIVDAFKGFPYPLRVPEPCPP